MKSHELAKAIMLLGSFSSLAYPQAAAVSGVVLQPDAESTFLNVLFENSNELNAENKQRLQQFVSSKLELGAARSRSGAEELLNTRRTIARNNVVSTISFALVHAVVLLGFAGALLEFRTAQRLRRRGKALEDIEITVKIESIAVKTTSLGVVLLATSIVFYFLYLKFVFPIQNVPL